MKRNPWLIVGTLIGVGLGFLTLPAQQGSSWRMERDAWHTFYWMLGAACLGLFAGLLADILRLR